MLLLLVWRIVHFCDVGERLGVCLYVYSSCCADVTTALVGVGLIHKNELSGRVDLDKGECWEWRAGPSVYGT